jgi:hypothetical protein
VNDYLQGAISELIRRGELLLTKIPTSLPREFHVLAHTCRQELSRILDVLEGLVDDPNMQGQASQPERLRKFRRAVRDMDFFETIGIAALNRANEDDRQLNLLVERIANEIGFPLLPPVATLLSQGYFHIYPRLNLLCLPLVEAAFLLHLPDLYHELGHLLEFERHDPRTKPFHQALDRASSSIAGYLADELKLEGRRRGPAEFSFYLQQWWRCWAESWLVELFCDLFAVYTVGPAFAWANLHLLAKRGADLFAVPTLVPSTHPADDARMKVMLYGLKVTGFNHELSDIEHRWDELVSISGSKPEPEYFRCFPDDILRSVASLAFDGISGMGCRMAVPATKDPIYTILNEAWAQFWNHPDEYPEWEGASISRLRSLGALELAT